MRKGDLSIVYYYIINEDLGMSKGKIAAQVSHVAMQLADRCGKLGRAIILRAPEQKLKEIYFSHFSAIEFIEDAGLTEVPKGSLTCIGFISDPILKKEVKDLKLV